MASGMDKHRLRIFRGGRQTTSAGQTIDFAEADLDAIVRAYDPAIHEAPIVIGHPRTDDPAFGWVKAVTREGDCLFAEAEVAPELAEAVKRGAYRKISAAFYAPDDTRNPTPGSYHLRHVGLLGAQVPSVKGLGAVAFAEGLIECEFAEGEATSEAVPQTDAPADATPDADESPKSDAKPEAERADAKPEAALPKNEIELVARLAELEAKARALAEREQRLIAAEAAQKRADAVSFAERLATEGRILPRDQAEVVEVLVALGEAPAVEFAEGESARQIRPDEWLRAFLGRVPRQVEFGELAAPDGAAFSEHDHRSPEARARDLSRQALKLVAEAQARGERLSLADAVSQLSGRSER